MSPNRGHRSHDAANRLASEVATSPSIPRSVNISNTSSGLTIRAVTIGLFNGVLICLANTYFGLQAGFTSTMTLTSSLLAFAIFRFLGNFFTTPFTPAENVVVTTVSGSFGTMSFTLGFIGIVPALEYLVKPEEGGPFKFTTWRLFVWAIGFSLLGVTIAPALRDYFLFRQRLKFPVGTSAAAMLGMLYTDNRIADNVRLDNNDHLPPGTSILGSRDHETRRIPQWETNIRHLWAASVLSSIWALVSHFVTSIRTIPIFGHYLESQWGWGLSTSPGYLAFGMLVKPSTSAWMALGTILGWGVLSPFAKYNGWAPGEVFDWDSGPQGWTVWIALGVISGDALVQLAFLSVESVSDAAKFVSQRPTTLRVSQAQALLPTTADEPRLGEDDPLVSGNSQQSPPLSLLSENPIARRTIILWAAVSLLLSLTSMWILFGSSFSLPAVVLAVCLILPLGVICIRAIGQTGSSAADSAGRLAQVIFSLILPLSSPAALIANMALANIAEAGAWQSAELMDEFKLGYLVSCPQISLLYAQIIGCCAGAGTASIIYRLYTATYNIPSESFPVPIAHMWYTSAKLMYQTGFPPHALSFALAAAALSAAFAVIQRQFRSRYTRVTPQAIPLAIGIFIRPSFILARGLGGLIRYYFLESQRADELAVISVASGLVLGDGVSSIFKFLLESLGVRAR